MFIKALYSQFLLGGFGGLDAAEDDLDWFVDTLEVGEVNGVGLISEVNDDDVSLSLVPPGSKTVFMLQFSSKVHTNIPHACLQ